MRKIVPRRRGSPTNGRERTGVKLQRVANVVEAQTVGQLRIAQTDHMTPRAKGSGLLVHSSLVGQARHQVGWNVIADLTQNRELVPGWGLLIFHDLSCDRFSSSFQSFFLQLLWDGSDWIWP